MTTAAAREVRTAGLDAFRRWREHALELGAGKSGAAFHDRRLDFFSRQNKWDENGLAASMFVGRQTRKPVAAVNQFFNSKLQNFSDASYDNTTLQAVEKTQ